MSISQILNSLEKSWERDDILLNIKKGSGTDEIVNEFIVKNERQIKELHSLLRPEDIDLFNLFVTPFASIPSFLQADNTRLLSTLRSLAIVKIGVLIVIILFTIEFTIYDIFIN